MELGVYACQDCGSPLRYRPGQRLRCLNAPGGQIDCGGRDPFEVRGPRPRVVDKYECTGGCGRMVKWRDGEPMPDELAALRECECGGMLIFKARQTR